MKKILIASLVATAFAPITFVAPVAAATVDGSVCGLNANQIDNGFTCTQTVETTDVSRVIGGGRRCQDATITTTITQAFNQRGVLMEDRTVVSEPTEADWGASYPNVGGCNF